MTRGWFPDVRTRPIAAGLMWAVLFAPLFALAQLVMGNDVTWRNIVVLIPIAIVGGLIWSFLVRWYLNRKANNARR